MRSSPPDPTADSPRRAHAGAGAPSGKRNKRTPNRPSRGSYQRAPQRAPHPFSPDQLAQRAALLPAITFPEQLPVSARRDEIAAAIRDHQVTIICGETGSGKTTQIPKICLQLGRGIGAMIGHTQPRRLAARAVADRIAQELGSRVSSRADAIVGYQVRFTDEVGPSTLVKLMTDGILLAEIQGDPLLRRYDTIIIDEAHERSLNIDFLLGYLKQLLPKRPDLKLIITSATIDSQRFAEHFANEDGHPAPVIEVSGRTFPVEIRYRPLSAQTRDEDGHAASSYASVGTSFPETDSTQALLLEDPSSELSTQGYGRGEDIDYFTAICHATDELCAEGPGDILVFLPGERDIRDAAEALRDHLGSRFISAGQASEKHPLDAIEVVPLYSRLSAAEQHRIFEPHPRRRVVLATNVAETSLTVPGIRYVIDPGLARISRYSNRTKVQRLPIEPISQASANQRSGRCGRLDDGVAIRLYSLADFTRRPQYTEPEILRTSLASVILQMISLGLGQVEDFPFLDAPAAAAVRQGLAVLDEIGAIVPTAAGGGAPVRLTRVGRDLARLPIDPRLGRMLIEAQRHGCVSEVIIIVAALSMQDVRERPEAFQSDADALHARFLDPTSDFITYLSLWRYLRLASRELSNSAMRRLCKREFLHYLRWREWQDVAQQLTELSKPLRLQVRPLELPTRADITFQERTAGIDGALARAAVDVTKRTSGANADAIHRSLLVGLLSNLGWWDPQRQVYEGARAAKFVIWPGSGLARKHYDWVMAAELVETTRLFARTVAKIDPAWVEPLAERFLKRSYSEPYWSSRQGAAMVREKVTLYGLTLAADRPVLLANLPADAKIFGDSSSATSVAARTLSGGSEATLRTGLGEAGATQLARDLFIRHALIEEDWDANYPFIRKNRAVLDDIRASEQKLRTGGAVSEDTLFSFYDERLPDSVVSQRSFDRWWRRTKQREALFLSREALLPDAQRWDPHGFPEYWEQSDVSLTLEYEFTPGSSRDGLNIRVPISVLAQVRDEGFEWLVPGMLDELVTATIRALPKQLRAQLVPAPQVGAELAQWIRQHVWGQTPKAENVNTGSPVPSSVVQTGTAEKMNGTSPAIEEAGAGAAGGDVQDTPVDPRSLEASLGRLAAWAQKSGAASQRSLDRMRAAAETSPGKDTTASPSAPKVPTCKEAAQDLEGGDERAPFSASAQSAADAQGREPRLPGTRAGATLPHFFTAFCDAARVAKGVDVPRSLWDELELPTHATATFVVVDERGRELRSAPNLTFLQNQLGSQARRAVRTAMREALEQAMREQTKTPPKPSRALKAFAGVEPGADLREREGHPDAGHAGERPRKEARAASIEQSSLVEWPTVDGRGVELPRQLETTTRAGLVVRGYPALVPEGSFEQPTAGVRVLTTTQEAASSHPQGLARLLVRRVGLAQTRVSTRWTGREALTLASGPYRSTPELIAQAQYASVLSLLGEFTPDPQSVRTQAEFEDLATWVRARHEDRVYQIVGYATDIFAAGAQLDAAIRAHSVPSMLRVLQDVRAHSQSLLTGSLLVEVPFAWLGQVARFLRADAVRVKKAASSAQALSRDEGLRREIAAVEQLIADRRAASSAGDEGAAARLSQARWLLEELRVSLFAQELGTSQKVSVKRLRNLVEG